MGFVNCSLIRCRLSNNFSKTASQSGRCALKSLSVNSVKPVSLQGAYCKIPHVVNSARAAGRTSSAVHLRDRLWFP